VAVESQQPVRSVSAPQRPGTSVISGSPHIDLTTDGLGGYVERAAQLRTPEHERFTHSPLPTQAGDIPNIAVDIQPLVLPQHQAANVTNISPADKVSAPLTQMASSLEVLAGLAPELRPLISQVIQENRALRARS